MIDGLNVENEAGVKGLILTAEQCDIPAVSAKIGGTQPTSILPLMPVGLLIAGIVSVSMAVVDPATYVADATLVPIEISVVPAPPLAAHVPALDLKKAYEQLRQQMLAEGLPFLAAADLEKEIADRKRTRA